MAMRLGTLVRAAGPSSTKNFFCSGISTQGSQAYSSMGKLPKSAKDVMGYARRFKPTTPLGDVWFTIVSSCTLTFGFLGIGVEVANTYLDHKYGKFDISKFFEVED